MEATKIALLTAGFKVKREAVAHIELVGECGKNKAQTIQLLRMSFEPAIDAVLDSFDFTICQFGFDGSDLVCGPFSLWDLARKRLAMHKITFGASSVRRMTKYSKQGFTFCQGTIVTILEAIAKDPTKIQAEVDYVD